MKTVFENTTYAFPLKIEQDDDGTFCITYGAHKRANLDYVAAAHEFGECAFHALACDGVITPPDWD